MFLYLFLALSLSQTFLWMILLFLALFLLLLAHYLPLSSQPLEERLYLSLVCSNTVFSEVRCLSDTSYFLNCLYFLYILTVVG